MFDEERIKSESLLAVTKQTTVTEMHVLTREELVKACQQPVAVGKQ